MSKPAARVADMTAHGGKIDSGCITVMIGGMAAARETDPHTCPMSDGPKPHIGGIIAKGSLTVFIGGLGAARMGDVCACMGPPNTIASGFPTVLIGG